MTRPQLLPDEPPVVHSREPSPRQRPEDVEPRAVAEALMATHRALVGYVRGSVLQGRRGRALASSARSQARRAFARLERGLAQYATGND
jgi:hypothetical protein